MLFPPFEQDIESDDGCLLKILIVPKFAVGKVIGRGGKTIEEIAKASGCKLEFRRMETKDNGDIPLHMVSLYDNMNDLLKAEKMVNKIVSVTSQIINIY